MNRDFQYIIDLAKKRNCKTVVEIGSIRSLKPDYQIGDGHSTIHWIEHFDEVYSYDIDPKATALTRRIASYKHNLIAECRDALDALKDFPKPIDLLYLDAWDVIPETDYRESHLEAFKLSENKLHEYSIILIDDMNYSNRGKGGLVMPYAVTKGWKASTLGPQMFLTSMRTPISRI